MMRLLSALLALTVASCGTPALAQSVSGCGTVAIAKADMTNVAKLAAAAACFEKVNGIASAAAKARRDRIIALTPPVPLPTHDHPAPAPAGWVPSPTLDGMAPIGSGLDVSSLLQPAWGTGALPGPEAPGIEGAERFLCAPSHNAYDDPIVYPGQPGKSHLHTFFGNTLADAHSTYASLRTTGDSTCNSALNRSAYWIPAMLRRSKVKGEAPKVVMPDWVSIYYKRAPQGSIYCAPPYAERCAQLPRDLRYIFGFNMIGPKHDPARFRWFNCDGPGAVSGHFATIDAAREGCPVGARLGAMIVGPNCWDGKHLDSPDHRSHMAYQDFDGIHAAPVCPKTHPILLPFFELGAWYRYDGSDYVFSSDEQMGLPAGTTLHADWYGAWEDSILKRWTDNCIDKALSCSGGDLGDGWQLKTTKGYDYPNGRPLVAVPPRPGAL